MSGDRVDGGISLVIETENVKDAGRDRAVEMLQVLRSEIAGVDDVEIVLVFDQDAASLEDVGELLKDGGLDAAAAEIEIVPTRETEYYTSKNTGARAASKGTLVLLDSDVIPESGWLKAMLAGVDTPGVDVVGGAVYIGPLNTLVDRAFAAFWFFPMRREAVAGLTTVQHLFANNMAMRRDFFLAHPFPEDREVTRGQCTVWAADLKRQGLSLWRDPTARVAHPAPEGFVFKRGLMRGHDRYLRGRAAGSLRRGALLTSLRMVTYEVVRAVKNIFRRRRGVGLRWFEVPGAVAVALYYLFAEWVGFVMEWLRPGLVRRWFA